MPCAPASTRWIDRHADVLQLLLTPAIDAAEALQRLHQLQILCALRDGPFGAQGLNDLIARRLAARFGIDGSRAWYHGRPVIITRNDYARGLFNGDVGIALEGTEGLRVWFELSDRDGSAGLRSYSPRALPAHDSAWAITIHRSQGSEYRDVAVVLPPDAGQPRTHPRTGLHRHLARQGPRRNLDHRRLPARRAGPPDPAARRPARTADSRADVRPALSPSLSQRDFLRS